ncbi:MAG: chemotaxis protein CheW [Myxococcota bacterium]
MDESWLRFEVAEQGYALPLGAVVEVTAAPRPHLIPRVSLEVGGVVNVRGEPLPAVDGGALLTGRPAQGHRHMLVLERGSLRIGVLAGAVQRIERAPALLERSDAPRGGELVEWVTEGDTALGLVDPDGLIERGILLLTELRGRVGGQEPWQSGF